jgi:prevent-host-death family protein
MKAKTKSIGSFQAKTHLSSLIENVQNGYEYTITKRGKPVAMLVPYQEESTSLKVVDVIKEFDTIRASVSGKGSIRSYIDEGRK